ncbi:signal peptidase I [Liquorilactobacillus mali]|uniref:signal peptidase I n=1 Tax=Liquorilactobacillus mali TaxID=1618 RepID=UPI00234FD11D|nr:signal peptidase I [Liquorilactobacillus mali]MDC7952206.1 signal peptidase I [Liquorilactobacillus mali]MDV7756864.1 signal peptidase I [Liquorilactobacillus mali]
MKIFKEIFSWILPIIVGLLIALIVKQFWFGIVKVDGTSMYPTLQNDERVMMLKQAKIKHNTVIVFNAYGVDKNNQAVTESTKYVKRVIGMPGDKIEYRSNGQLYINGKKMSQGYITKSQRTTGTLTLVLKEAKGVKLGTGNSFTVPKGKYFVLGDNRKDSNDSRYYGFVPKSKVDGVIKVPFWNSKKSLVNSYSSN